MTTTNPNAGTGQPIAIAASWERPVVSVDGDDIALMLRITTRQRINLPGQPRRAPIDVAVVLDRSGSMSGEKIRLVKEAVDVAIGHLDDNDRVSLVTFDSVVEVVQPLAQATAGTKAELRSALDDVDARGTTYLSGGWLNGCQQLAAAQPSFGLARIQRALLLTDGLANMGITDPGRLTRHASEIQARGIATTAMGVGVDFDEMLLSAMAEAGGGNFRFIGHPSELPGFFADELGELTNIVGLRPKLELTLPHGMRARLVNAFPVKRVAKTLTIDLRDLASGDEIDLIFTIRTVPGTAVRIPALQATLTWTDPESGRNIELGCPIDPISRVSAEEAAIVPTDDVVRERAGLELAARAHREAIRLDREGLFEESRHQFRCVRQALLAAPQSADVRDQIRISEELASSSVAAPLSERICKERVAYHSRHSRGGRRPENTR